MEIIDLKITQPPGWTDPRCEMVVSKAYQWRNGKCKRFAMFNLDGVNYCKQHAGEEALNYFLLNNGKDNEK